jgi:alkylated DNA repair dioxygenase AlkB
MDLFSREHRSLNLLPYEGCVVYYGQIMSVQQADGYFEALCNSIAWQHDEAIIYGKRIITKRKVAWYGDRSFSYTYSKVTKHALPWNSVLLELKQMVERMSGESFNACLLNLYHDGQEGMAWHSDGEVDLEKNATIASLSFGAQRKFAFKHKITQQKVELYLAHGSLLLMQESTQTYWLHRLPPSSKISTARINLSFRHCVETQL